LIWFVLFLNIAAHCNTLQHTHTHTGTQTRAHLRTRAKERDLLVGPCRVLDTQEGTQNTLSGRQTAERRVFFSDFQPVGFWKHRIHQKRKSLFSPFSVRNILRRMWNVGLMCVCVCVCERERVVCLLSLLLAVPPFRVMTG